MKDTNSRITRWYLAMQPFRFVVQYVPGKANATADFLSRYVSEAPEGGGSVMASDLATQQIRYLRGEKAEFGCCPGAVLSSGGGPCF
ncbi:hypothetical protein QQF64_036357 [Cirrhinus molitorella]|uniref:Uncharacterized protein n=1 Tax=Cirrhinus molitorella TaxID=172907 RepID=A0ABR3NIE1_9TELE